MTAAHELQTGSGVTYAVPDLVNRHEESLSAQLKPLGIAFEGFERQLMLGIADWRADGIGTLAAPML